MSKQIKIGVDYHGVITANPDFFKKFNEYAINNNCLIYVISGGSEKDIKKFMEERGILYSKIWSTLDYYDALNEVEHFADGSFKVDDVLWDKAKGWYCAANKIDFHIDDSVIYGKYFTTPFCLYEIMEKRCFINGTYIDLNQSPKEVLSSILAKIKK